MVCGKFADELHSPASVDEAKPVLTAATRFLRTLPSQVTLRPVWRGPHMNSQTIVILLRRPLRQLRSSRMPPPAGRANQVAA